MYTIILLSISPRQSKTRLMNPLLLHKKRKAGNYYYFFFLRGRAGNYWNKWRGKMQVTSSKACWALKFLSSETSSKVLEFAISSLSQSSSESLAIISPSDFLSLKKACKTSSPLSSFTSTVKIKNKPPKIIINRRKMGEIKLRNGSNYQEEMKIWRWRRRPVFWSTNDDVLCSEWAKN